MGWLKPNQWNELNQLNKYNVSQMAETLRIIGLERKGLAGSLLPEARYQLNRIASMPTSQQ